MNLLWIAGSSNNWKSPFLDFGFQPFLEVLPRHLDIMVLAEYDEHTNYHFLKRISNGCAFVRKILFYDEISHRRWLQITGSLD